MLDSNVTASLSHVIKGELGPRYASAFDGMTVRAHNGATEITGPIIDQSHLQGLLGRIAGLGLTLESLNPLETENAGSAAQTHTQPAGVNDHDSGANRMDRESHDLSLDSAGHPVRSVLGLLRPGDVPQRALLAVLDRVLPSVPVDHRGIDRPHSTRRQHRIERALHEMPIESLGPDCAPTNQGQPTVSTRHA
jgi:hypothetical protein